MKWLIPFSVLCLSTSAAYAAEAVSLQDSVALALQHAPALQAEEAAHQAKAEGVTQDRALLMPYISVNGSIKKQKQSFTYNQPIAFLRTGVNTRETSYGIQAMQPLFDLSKWAQYRLSQEALATADSKLELKRQQTILQAASAWLDVFRLQAGLKAAQANEKAMLRLHRQASTAFRIGTASVNESLAAKSRYDLAQAARIRSEHALQQAQATLDSLLGRHVEVRAHVPEQGVALPLQPAKLEAWEKKAEQYALAIQLAGHQKQLAESQYLEALGNAMPKVQLVAGWNKTKNTDGSFGGSSVQTSMIGIELNAPLYAGGALSARRRQAVQEKVQADYVIAEAKRSTRLATQQAWFAIQSSLAELNALQQAETSAKQALQATKVGFEVGLRSLNDVMDNRQRLTATQQSYADALARYAMSWLQLHATAGVLKSDDLSTVNKLLIDE